MCVCVCGWDVDFSFSLECTAISNFEDFAVFLFLASGFQFFRIFSLAADEGAISLLMELKRSRVVYGNAF